MRSFLGLVEVQGEKPGLCGNLSSSFLNSYQKMALDNPTILNISSGSRDSQVGCPLNHPASLVSFVQDFQVRKGLGRTKTRVNS